METNKCTLLRTLLLLLAISSEALTDSENSTDVQQASVEEVPNPTMTIEGGDTGISDYRLPGYYTFNNGEPFYLEKDPVTGAIDFSKKSSTGVTGYGSTPIDRNFSKDQQSAQDKVDVTESEYYEDEESGGTDPDFKEDTIDRKDGNVNGDAIYRPNDILKNPFKISPDLHQFLNLPVRYSTNDKYPLISSSYANTKIQGTGSSSSSGSYSNHKYGTTSSTQSPSYYTLRPSTTTTTTFFTTTTTPETVRTSTKLTTVSTRPTTTESSTVPSTTITTPSTRRTTTTPKPAYPEYPEGEDLVYSDYDMEYSQPHRPPQNFMPTPISPLLSSPRLPVTAFQPTIYATVSTTTRKPAIVNPFIEEEVEEDNVSIVTSLPGDYYYSQNVFTTSSTQKPSTTIPTTTTTTTPEPTTVTTTSSTTTTQAPTTQKSTPSLITTKGTTTTLKKETISTTTGTRYTEKLPSSTRYTPSFSDQYKPSQSSIENQYYGLKENFEPMIDEPFRPIFGPLETSSPSSFTLRPVTAQNEIKSTPGSQTKPYFEYHAPAQAKPLPNQGKIEFIERLPTGDQPNKFNQKPGVKLPPAEPAVSDFSNEFNRPHQSGQSTRKPFPEIESPFGRPPSPGQILSSLLHGTQTEEAPLRPQNRPPFIRLPDDTPHPFHIKKHSNGTVVKVPRPEEVIYPHQRPVGVLPPSGIIKSETKPNGQVVKFHPPMKHDNHFIKVPLNEENPSYSLQTSFSIGMPGQEDPGKEPRPGQGVGQVLFADGTPDTSLQSNDPEKSVQTSPVRPRPPGTRPYITSYNQNNLPQGRPPSILPQRPPQRLPIPEMRPPKPGTGGDSYPRPHWETHSKPLIFNSPQNPGAPKPDFALPFPAVNRIKSEPNSQRHDLPNILPQFRPNAKVGANEFSILSSGERMREPVDTLQPPPLPQPQHLRVNRNDDSLEDDLEKPDDSDDDVPVALVHRRTGPQPANRVTTLQMMQQGPPRRNLVRTDYHEHRQERPVYLVYPANGGSKPAPQNEGVVVGTRGPHQPLPPSNLDTPVNDEVIDDFPLDDGKQFSLPQRDRVDTPILKTKTSSKPPIKNDFPYEILRPKENIIPEERIMAGSTVTKEYNAFSPTLSSSSEDIKDPDAEINLIPYLQDYMPFATKKPALKPLPISNLEKKPELLKPSTVKPISVTLNTRIGSTTLKPDIPPHDHVKHNTPHDVLLPNLHDVPLGMNGNNEFTVGASYYHKKIPQVVNHRPVDVALPLSTSTQPKPLDLEAPFQASLSAPHQGWTVVKSSADKNKQDTRRESEDQQESKSEVLETKFDFDSFKPQLFGGFKPILSSEEKSPSLPNMESSSTDSDDKSIERQEKKYR